MNGRGYGSPVWLLLALSAIGAVVTFFLTTSVQLDELSTSLVAHRYAWYAPPLVVLAFVVFSLVPVVVLVSLTGVAFGPVLGPIYAMAGCLASASTAFALGRWLGQGRVRAWQGGARVARLTRALHRNGTLAVFLVRKVPAPFMLVNVLLGASAVRYREFVAGTALGMTAMVIALAGLGYQLAEAWRDPSVERVVPTLLFLTIPLTVAWLINQRLRAGNRDVRDL